jgi:hypothetical protein
MITNNTNGEVIRSGTTSEQVFKIKASAEAFKILSSALYSNKIRAIIRELSANAYDAHKEANNTQTPFQITLPNTLNPVFSIRDYGTGISPDNILTIYTTYFESPKTASNDYVGCMGLGSKTPLCYTDSFLVNSYYNGKKYIYSVFLNESGFPSITFFSEEDTVEHNGLEITFNVDSSDFQTFLLEAKNLLKYYNPLPIIIGRTDVNLTPVEYKKIENGWGIRKNNTESGMQAIMGKIAYPITNCAITDNISASIDIFFDIGEFEVTASREEISYGPNTLKIIQEKVKKTWNELQQLIDKQMAQANSYWEATQIYSDMVNFYKGTNILQSLSVKWNEKYITSVHMPFFPDDIFPDDTYTKFKSLNFRMLSYSSRSSDKKLRNITYISFTSKYTLVQCDVTYAISKRAYSAETQTDTSVIIFDDPNNLWDEYKKTIGIPDIIPVRKLSEFDYKKPKSKANSLYCKKVLVWKDNKWDIPEKFNINQNGVYVVIERFKIHGASSYDYIKNYIELLNKFNIDTSTLVLYGIKESIIKKFQNNPGWITFEQYCKQQIEANLQLNKCLLFSLTRHFSSQKIDMLYNLSALKPELQDYQIYDHIPVIDKYRKEYWEHGHLGNLFFHFCTQIYHNEIQKMLDGITACEDHIQKYCPYWFTHLDKKPDTYKHINAYLKTFLPKKVN